MIIGVTSQDPDPSRLDDTELAHESLEVTRRVSSAGTDSNQSHRLGVRCDDVVRTDTRGAPSIFTGKS